MAGSGDGTAMKRFACLNLLTPSPTQIHINAIVTTHQQCTVTSVVMVVVSG